MVATVPARVAYEVSQDVPQPDSIGSSHCHVDLDADIGSTAPERRDHVLDLSGQADIIDFVRQVTGFELPCRYQIVDHPV